ncbi:hypothetical protein JJB09_03325 [Rhizobium sp. KVB221]|uniref:Calcium-binding protein n=1 Tax=Rhizobium setariae TaxID=2801340 RepID=A0A937CMK9_9HYPH|nr:calcium-binding protein [Rhizobium setariae]MBL0371049.1 hypothetical protein [Rhizobium setariae]
MSFIVYDDWSGNPASYNGFRMDVMTAVWGTSKQPYVDANNLPFIGIGFNMKTSFADFEIIARGVLGADYTTNLVKVLWNVAIDGAHPNDTTAKLQQRLNDVMDDNDIYRNFEFLDVRAMRGVLDALAVVPESTLNWMGTGIPVSEERAAVFSVAFEGADVQDILQQMLVYGDRFQAWFEMRYDTPNLSDLNAVARRETAMRRYVQSDTFELYNDPNNVDYAEAENVARGFQSQRNAILAYEQKYDPTAAVAKAAALGGAQLTGDIYNQLQPAIEAIVKEFKLAGTHLEEVLFVRRSDGAISGDGTVFDSSRNDDDLLIGDDRDNAIRGQQGADLVSGLAGNDMLNGGDGNDRIDGDHGNDLLNGASGNDILNGGNGNDTLAGGLGNDRLIGGAGNDRLEGGTGNDTYFLTPLSKSIPPAPTPNPSLVGGNNDDVIVEAANAGTDRVIIDMAGSFDIRNVERMQLTGNVNGQVSLVLNQFERITLSSKADDLTLTINKLQKDAIDIVTGAGADTVQIRLAPGIDPSQVLDHKGLTARFDFTDLTAADTIDLTALNIKKIVASDLDVTLDSGFYLMAPDAQIHLMRNGSEIKTYTNDTDSWFVVRLGDNTPYGPEFIGDIHKGNFDI